MFLQGSSIFQFPLVLSGCSRQVSHSFAHVILDFLLHFNFLNEFSRLQVQKIVSPGPADVGTENSKSSTDKRQCSSPLQTGKLFFSLQAICRCWAGPSCLSQPLGLWAWATAGSPGQGLGPSGGSIPPPGCLLSSCCGSAGWSTVVGWLVVWWRNMSIFQGAFIPGSCLRV